MIPYDEQYKIFNGQYYCMGIGCDSILATYGSFSMHKSINHRSMIRKWNTNKKTDVEIMSVPEKYREKYQQI